MQILFVSDMDLHRGPMARVLAQLHAHKMNVFDAAFDSAGVKVAKRFAPPPQFTAYLRGHGLNILGHVSKPITSELVSWADLVLTMTHDIAKQAREMVGPAHAGKVVVLNESVGFGASPKLMDIEEINIRSTQHMLAMYSQMKASTGRLVRMISEGDNDPRDYGAVAVKAKSKSYLDEPHIRHFLGRYVAEYVERAFEPPTSEQIRQALTVLGRPLSLLELDELIRTDLKGKIRKDDLGRWDVDERVQQDEKRDREAREQQARQRAEAEREEREKQASSQKQGAKKPQRDAPLTVEEALESLSITMDTPRDDAQKLYRKLLMRYHPDKFHDDDEFRAMAETKTKRINEAWALLEEKLPTG